MNVDSTMPRTNPLDLVGLAIAALPAFAEPAAEPAGSKLFFFGTKFTGRSKKADVRRGATKKIGIDFGYSACSKLQIERTGAVKTSGDPESMSYIVQMFGWFRADAACASRTNLSKDCGSLERLCGKNLSATLRLSLVSSARYTTPIPPPSFSRMR